VSQPARRLAVVLALVLVAAACPSRRRLPEPVGPTAWREWIATSDSAERLATMGEVEASDSTLMGFVRRWPGTPEAEEATWRVFVHSVGRLDDSTAATVLITRVDSALAATPTSAQRAQLQTMKRLAQLSHLLRAERALLRTERDTSRVRAEELERLRAELAQTQAELERVRKRVTRRRPST
jgi:hypothetical protein